MKCSINSGVTLVTLVILRQLSMLILKGHKSSIAKGVAMTGGIESSHRQPGAEVSFGLKPNSSATAAIKNAITVMSRGKDRIAVRVEYSRGNDRLGRHQ